MQNQRDHFFEWGSRVARMEYPSDPAALTALRECRLTSPAKWGRFICFCLFLGFEYGKYGTEIRPAQVTMSEDFGGVGRSTVARWLTAAEALGIFVKVADATPPYGCATYSIGAPWVSVPASPAGLSGVSGDPWAVTEPPPF